MVSALWEDSHYKLYAMKQGHIMRFWAFLLVLIFQNNICSQEVELVTFDEYVDYSQTNLFVEAKAKAKRVLSKRGGSVVIQHLGEEMPDSLKQAVEVAKDVWSSYMNIGDSLILNVYYNDTTGFDISTEMGYKQLYSGGANYPISICRNLNVDGLDEYPVDASIRINSNTPWCVGLSNSDEPNKLLFAMLQHIGRSLGYGSSVKKKGSRISFGLTNAISVFDSLIFSDDGRYMKDIPVKSTSAQVTQLTNFVEQSNGYLYALEESDKYKIYAPSTFDNQKSLKYSCDSTSVMFYGNRSNNSLNIDDVTIKLLSEIGWDLGKITPIEIVGEDIDSTGIASGLQSHRFYFESNGRTLTNHEWIYMLPLHDGGYDTIMVSSAENLIIPAVNDASRYDRTVDGDVRALIMYSGLSNNTRLTASYSLTLEFSPLIKQCIVTLTPNAIDDTYYDATVEVFYDGGNYLHGYVEEEYGYTANTVFSTTPYYTRMIFKGIDSWGYAWINIVARNDCGSNTYTIEIPPGAEYAIKRNRKFSGNDIKPICRVLQRNDTLTFMSNGKKQGTWSAYVLLHTDTGEEVYTKFLEENNSSTFEVYANHNTVNWKKSVRIEDMTNGHTYFKGIVVFRDETECDTVNIKFDLVPTRPVIEKVTFTYDYFDYEWGYYENAIYNINISSEGWQTMYSYETPPYEGFNEKFLHSYICEMDTLDNDMYAVEQYHTWEQRIFFVAYNEYGSSIYSDTISTVDYIDDSKVLEYIYETTLVENATIQDSFDFTIKDGVLFMDGEVRSCSVCTLDGRKVRQEDNVRFMDLRTLDKGTYCITIIDNNNKINSKKVVL